jgi:hypothetical protein
MLTSNLFAAAPDAQEKGNNPQHKKNDQKHVCEGTEDWDKERERKGAGSQQTRNKGQYPQNESCNFALAVR